MLLHCPALNLGPSPILTQSEINIDPDHCHIPNSHTGTHTHPASMLIPEIADEYDHMDTNCTMKMKNNTNHRMQMTLPQQYNKITLNTSPSLSYSFPPNLASQLSSPGILS